jgi:hypothetical protein
VLAFQEGSILEEKIRRICQSFPGEVFEAKLATLSQELE